jgi:hypothetical protein
MSDVAGLWGRGERTSGVEARIIRRSCGRAEAVPFPKPVTLVRLHAPIPTLV